MQDLPFTFLTNLFVIVATPEINPIKFKATLSALRILFALPFKIARTLPFLTFFPSIVFVIKMVFLSKVLNVSFAKLRPPIIQF